MSTQSSVEASVILERSPGSEDRLRHRIPKRMIQTGKSVEQPLRTRAMVCNIKLLNPDYDYLFLDDRDVEDFVESEFPRIPNGF